MFTYYGTKKKLSSLYPKPSFDTIVEPFAGAAMYSLYDDNWKKNVILCDKYDKIYLVWKFLIDDLTIKDINNLPDLKEGLNLDKINISDEERILLGFYCNPSSGVPKKTVSKRGEISWPRYKKFLIENILKIKHWKIYNKSYDELDNITATWFIDPPYFYGGQYYHSSVSNKHINYNFLKDWCLSRNGEIIVCENDKANWLPFTLLSELKGQLHKTNEVIYYKNNEKD